MNIGQEERFKKTQRFLQLARASLSGIKLIIEHGRGVWCYNGGTDVTRTTDCIVDAASNSSEKSHRG